MKPFWRNLIIILAVCAVVVLFGKLIFHSLGTFLESVSTKLP